MKRYIFSLLFLSTRDSQSFTHFKIKKNISIRILKTLVILATYLCATQISYAQVVTTLAGNGSTGNVDGTGTAARFTNPRGITYDGVANLFVADRQNHSIRKIVIATGVVTTLAGSTTGVSGNVDGTGAAAKFNKPYAITYDGVANLFVTELGNHRIRKIEIATGVVTTLAGSIAGNVDATGAAARFNLPFGIAYDGIANLFVADGNNHSIRKIVVATGVVTTLAGNGTSGNVDATGATARFNQPAGITHDGANLFVVDAYNHSIRKIGIVTGGVGVVTTLAGNGTGGNVDATGAAARFETPYGITYDGFGNLFVADTYNHTIRKIVIATGVVTTLAGNGTSGNVDATGAAAGFNTPRGITYDGTNLFVVDGNNHSIRKITTIIPVTCVTPVSICYPTDCSSNYANNQTNIVTYQNTSNSNKLRIVFTAFNLESCCDKLEIYDGTNASGTPLATYKGSSIPASITSTGNALTLKFTSDYSVNYKGFKANISCVAEPKITKLIPAVNSGNNAENTNLFIYFDQRVTAVAGKSIHLISSGTNFVLETISVTSTNVSVTGDRKKIVINPSANLPFGDMYVLIEPGAFKNDSNDDFAGYTSLTDWYFTVRDFDFDAFAGKAAQFTENASSPSYAEVPDNSAFDLQDAFHIEFWIKIDKLKQDQKVLGKANNGASKGYLIGFTNGQLFCEFWDTAGKLVELKGGEIKENKWTHTSITWNKSTGDLVAYLDGIEVARVGSLVNSWGTNTNSLILGADSRNTNQFQLNGQMDEIRIWAYPRSVNTIRKNMYLTLNKTSPELISYWQCNDANTTQLLDDKGLFHATLRGAATKVSSTLPVGGGKSERHVINTSGTQFIQDFPIVDLKLTIKSYANTSGSGEIVVTRINGNPNPVLSHVIAPYSNNYWIARLYGGGDIEVSPTFKFNNFLTNSDNPLDISIFKRGPQSHLKWDFVATSTGISLANQTASFSNYTDYNMQFTISRGNARQLDSLALVSLYNSTDGANWTKKWDLATAMTTWAGVEVEDRRVVKLQLFENNLVGTLPLGLDTLSELRIMNLRTNKLSGTIPSDLGNLAKLQVLNLRANELEGEIPVNLGNLISLTNLILAENNLEELPNFTSSNLKNLQLLSVHTNKLTFEDLTHNVGFFPDFVYSPQQKVNDEKQMQVVEGSTITIKTTVGGTDNQYQWFKDGDSLKQNSTTDSYTISNFKGINIGTYHCKITNDKAPDLTLIRNEIIIITTLNEGDSLILLSLYNATDGPNWKNKWDLTTPISEWYGVKLVNNSRVIEVKLPGNNLVGTLPADIGNLSEMITMDLGSNKIKGVIPTSLGNLEKMRFIFLHNNLFTGTIPSELGLMTNVEVLLLRGNKLTGDLPNSFTKLLKLRRLEVQGNELTGLPTFPKPNKLEALSVENNKLTFAAIEANIGVTADFNYFPQGEINTNLDESAAWKSDITFSTAVDGTQNKYQWKKGINKIGTLSTNKTFTIESLDYSDAGVYTCEVTNSLVPNLVLIRKEITLEINPPGINQGDSLALVALYNATDGANWQIPWDLQDEVETWSGVTVKDDRVIKLNLSSNNLVGTLPVELGNIGKLQELNLQSNTISGGMPPEIGNLTQLTILNLSLNVLTGKIPDNFGHLIKIELLDFHNNKLEGTIPVFGANFPSLSKLNLSDNHFLGLIPKELGLLTGLTELGLSSNALTGKVPDDFTKLSKLRSLFLDNNSFTHLPDFRNLQSLKQLNVDGNSLTFEDLEYNINVPNFKYTPQTTRVKKDTLANLGDNIVLNELVGGSANSYEWFKKDNSVRVKNAESSYTLSNVKFANIAVYKVEVSNNIADKLTLTYEFNLKVNPETPTVAAPEPYCYGDTVIVLSTQGVGGIATRWYSGLNVLLGEEDKIRVSLTQDRQTFYATNVASGIESPATAIEIILRPTITKVENTLVIDHEEEANYQWHFNREPIEGATSNILTIREDGSGDGFYSVTIFTKEGCEATSKNIEIKGTLLLTALEDDTNPNKLRIYPNPSQDILNIALNNTYFGSVKIKITNSLGKELISNDLQKNSQEFKTSIDISDLPNGMYILELNTETGTFIRKIIKK